MSMAAQFLRCRGRSLWLQRCDFRTVKKPSPVTTAAQNIHVFLRKSPLCRSHFFEWLKTLNSSTACGTVTLKSLLSLGSDAPHVHLRPRKHFSRCTLDCGFKTSESPALRGFVGGPWALATAALYLVLKSNGYNHPEDQLKKFGFSLKNHLRKYRQKVIRTLTPQISFLPHFQLCSQMPHVRVHSRKQVHTRLSDKNRT